MKQIISSDEQSSIDEPALLRRIEFRIVPILFCLWLINYLDRVNISFAALEMRSQLALSAEVYGFAAGIFFIGYILFEIPSNMLLTRFGARFWLTRIIVTWGAVSILQAFVWDARSLVAVRFLLGLAEAGFLPGVLYYLTRWFDTEHKAQVIGKIMSANLLAIVIGAPISTGILAMGAWGGLQAWQWIFILEGAPAIIFGIVGWFMLRDEPADANWLRAHERIWLQNRLETDRTRAEDAGGTHDFSAAIRQPIVWMLGILYLLNGIGFFGVTLWLPQIIRQGIGGSSTVIGALSALPYLLGAVTMVINGRHSDRTHERRWHLATPLAIAALALGTSAFLPPVASYIAVCLAVGAIGATFSVFWAIPSAFLIGRAAAGGLALINVISGLSGFISPWLVGFMHDQFHDFKAALVVMATALLTAAIVAARLPFRQYERKML